MTKINLSPQFYRIHRSDVEPVKETTTEKGVFAKSITAVRNSFISLSTSLSERFSLHKQTDTPATHFHRGNASEGRAVLTNKIVKDFMLQKLNSLDIKGNASKDPDYARQTCEAMLSSVYSNNKDQCCKLLVSKGISITSFLKEIGEAAQNAGLPGEIKNGIFTPGGAGTNPFVVPLIASASVEYPHMFINYSQQVSFKAYAEKIIMKEVTPLFNEGTMPTPQQFQLTVENIANKYLQNAS
ncbi:type III secretion system guanine nucleotide exchange factor SopE2 [Salmonella enterica subsp. arizonae serovar 13,23:g,z51:-]|nr:type III secretion system guanine nucleotide exchange factor SopE2 [Salmonella enterica subsp. enterica]ECU8377987.1 type III secretion system guanine nucleotide exchange factor SopE2 [Salmonella enterica subsp. arizonae serovar 13,23:gz51:-]EDR4666732.1 type III secretion system guanine nucleotide exchange factor SopE2 [Salmonella enterica]EDR4453916.1 type III secretion system guanine nucleotide exchange factor SopE2 [Salmonella enterica subsp. arizonae serovar 13,23:gz51:-]EDT8060444.1 ty